MADEPKAPTFDAAALIARVEAAEHEIKLLKKHDVATRDRLEAVERKTQYRVDPGE